MNKKQNLRKTYQEKINQAIDYIRQNLCEPINLEEISEAADFSPFHFHRIFSSMMGETLNNFVKRLRMEKGASMLSYDQNASITDIALECGFASSQTFSRAFKQYFKTSPSKYRNENSYWSKNGNIESKDYHFNSKNWEDSTYVPCYINTSGRPHLIYKSKKMDTKVEVKKMDDVTVAYVRHIGPYKGDAEVFGKLFAKISKWAGVRNLLNEDSVMYSVYYEDSDVTDESKSMVDVCISVPGEIEVGGEIGKQVIPGGEYAVARFNIKDPEEYGKAWHSLYNEWLPESGYLPDNRPAFEMYSSDCRSGKDQYKHTVDICIPVKAA